MEKTTHGHMVHNPTADYSSWIDCGMDGVEQRSILNQFN